MVWEDNSLDTLGISSVQGDQSQSNSDATTDSFNIEDSNYTASKYALCKTMFLKFLFKSLLSSSFVRIHKNGHFCLFFLHNLVVFKICCHYDFKFNTTVYMIN